MVVKFFMRAFLMLCFLKYFFGLLKVSLLKIFLLRSYFGLLKVSLLKVALLKVSLLKIFLLRSYFGLLKVALLKVTLRKILKKNKGMAMLEALPIIWVMFVLMGATLGSWGIVHTAILHSISARNYTFFLFNNRSDLSYLRDFSKEEYGELSSDIQKKYYRDDDGQGKGKRFHYISEKDLPDNSRGVFATTVKVDFREDQYKSGDRTGFLGESGHNRGIWNIESRNKQDGGKKVGPAWIMVGYGICLSEKCGD